MILMALSMACSAVLITGAAKLDKVKTRVLQAWMAISLVWFSCQAFLMYKNVQKPNGKNGTEVLAFSGSDIVLYGE